MLASRANRDSRFDAAAAAAVADAEVLNGQAGGVHWQRAALTGARSATIGRLCRLITAVVWHRCHGNSLLLLQQQQQHRYR